MRKQKQATVDKYLSMHFDQDYEKLGHLLKAQDSHHPQKIHKKRK